MLIKKITSGSIDSKCLKSICALYTGAGAVSVKDQCAVRDMLSPDGKLYHSYGMTETTHVVLFGEVKPDKPGSSGRLLPCMKAKVCVLN